MAVLDVTQKTEIYHTLYQLSSAFAAIAGNCEKLRQSGMLTPKYSRLFQAFAQKVQGELHGDVLLTLQGIEDETWAQAGKVRNKWEKYLRGSDPKPRKKTASPENANPDSQSLTRPTRRKAGCLIETIAAEHSLHG